MGRILRKGYADIARKAAVRRDRLRRKLEERKRQEEGERSVDYGDRRVVYGARRTVYNTRSNNPRRSIRNKPGASGVGGGKRKWGRRSVASEQDWEKADRKFSERIRNRDGRCQRPLCPNRTLPPALLTCSHFFNRAIWSLRYNEDNCITLCRWCHYQAPDCWERQKKTAYKEYMVKRLGKRRFNALERIALDSLTQKVDKETIIKDALEWLNQ